jgi:putative FmdB family regulatory protein
LRLWSLDPESVDPTTIGFVPIYEFQCPACDERFEKLVAPDTDRAACPNCSSAAERRLSAPASPRSLTMSPGEARRAEDKRGIERGGALQRFRQQRAREKRATRRHD